MSADVELTFEEQLLRDGFGEMLVEMRRAAEEAEAGSVLNDLESIVMDRGRDLLRQTLEVQLQTAAESAEKKVREFAGSANRLCETRERVRETL